MTPPAAWSDLAFFHSDWPALSDRLAADPRPFAPPADRVFRALDLVAPGAARVVILGQDPYPTAGNADGLAFSVPAGHPLPASLRNIFAEMQDDIGARPGSGDLSPWAAQGVLLLNTVLTVPVGSANGHRDLGWQGLARDVLSRMAERPMAFVLWGVPAQRLAAGWLDPARHMVIESPHPSPLSARRGFFGSRPFSRINAWLVARGESPIHWA